MPTEILMPALSPTMEEGKLAKWLVREGDEVHSGDVLAEIETDKATMEFEAIDEGRVGKILVPEGTEGVKVNQPIAVLLGEGEESSQPAMPVPAKDAVPKSEAPAAKSGAPDGDIASAMQSIRAAVSAEAPQQSKAPEQSNGKEGGRIFATPLARRLAA